MNGPCDTYFEGRNPYRVLVGNPEGERALGTPRPRLDVDFKFNFKETELETLESVNLTQ
jgi:hypothetical protein